MVDIMFRFGSDMILVSVKGNQLWFSNTAYGPVKAPIEGIKLSYQGVMKEFPDLKDSPDWKGEAIKRLKARIKSYKTEKEKADYIIKEFTKLGYQFHLIQFQGGRPLKKWH